MLHIKRFIVSDEKSNCYIINEGQNAIMIDCGEYLPKIRKYLVNNDLKLKAILITHGHYDHIDGIYALIDLYHPEVYFCDDDALFIKKPFKHRSFQEEIMIDGIKIKCFETPGHSAGSYSFLINNCLFTGDVLFKDGIGRDDLKNANRKDLENSIRFLFELDENLKVYPGHDDSELLKNIKSNILI